MSKLRAIQKKKKDEKNELIKTVETKERKSQLGNFIMPHRQKNVTHAISTDSSNTIADNIFFNRFI